MGLFKRNKNASYMPPAKHVLSLQIRSEQMERTSTFAFERKLIEQHREWENAFASTVIGQLLSSQSNMMFSQGYSLTGDVDDDQIADVQKYLDDMEFDRAMRLTDLEARKHGYGVCEIAPSFDGRFKPIPVSSVNLKPVYDEKGYLDGFAQLSIENPSKEISKLSLRQCVRVTLTPSLIDEGISKIARAWQPLKDYCDITKASVNIIWKHGFPSWNIQIGADENGLVPADVPSELEGVLADLSPGSAVSTGMGTVINELNKGGVPSIQSYVDFALQQLAVALGMPRASVGLLDNSEATSKVTSRDYLNTLAAEGKVTDYAWQTGYLDKFVLPQLGMKAGDVKIIINHPDPEIQLSRVQYVQALTQIDPMDPYALKSKSELASLLGFHPRKGEYDEGGEDSIETLIAQALKENGYDGSSS